MAVRPIQTWVRTAGTVDSTGRILTAVLRSPEAELVKEGQRATAFTVNSRTRMHLARVSRVTKREGGALIEATLPVQVPRDGTRYLMEIVTERGPYLSIPNVSIIEEGDEHIVYIQKEPGRYVRRRSRPDCRASSTPRCSTVWRTATRSFRSEAFSSTPRPS